MNGDGKGVVIVHGRAVIEERGVSESSRHGSVSGAVHYTHAAINSNGKYV